MSERAQIGILWWSLVFTVVYGLSLYFLLDMLPPPAATMSASEIATWYAGRASSIKLGATISGWTGAFMLPMWIVIGIQISRQEKGRPVWTALAMAGGVMSSLFLVLPPIIFGTAAFTPNRSPDTTAMMHEFGVFCLVTTDQFFIFAGVSLIAMCLRPSIAPHSPFPRWFAYFNIWFMMLGEAGALPFLFRSGVFSWNGLFPFWLPFSIFGIWMIVMYRLLFKALRQQLRDARTEAATQPDELPPAPVDVQRTGPIA